MTTGIYAGSFDPITNGHVWMIQEALKLFETVYVAIGVNPAKKTMFTMEKRRDFIEQEFEWAIYCTRLQVITFENEYLINIAKQHECTHLLRGIRTFKDFEEEVAMAEINKQIGNIQNDEITTVFLAPPPHLALVSSSMVKSLIGFQGWEEQVKKYVPSHVVDAFIEKVK